MPPRKKRKKPDQEETETEEMTEKETEQEEHNGEESQEPEEEPKELADVLYEAYLEFKEEKQKLNEVMEQLKTTTEEVRQIIYAPIKKDSKGVVEPPDEFVHTDIFLTKLDALSEFFGQALDYVIRLEKVRRKYNFPMGETPEQLTGAPEEEEASSQPPNQQQPINVTLSQPQRAAKGGFFDYLIARTEYKMLKEREVVGNKQPVTTTERVDDVLEFGRQLIPAVNKIRKWLPGTVAGFRFFKSEDRYFLCHQQLQMFLGQTLSTLTAFVKAYVEYKSSVIDGRKVSLNKSFARIVEAQGAGSLSAIQHGGTFMPKGMQLGPQGFTQRK